MTLRLQEAKTKIEKKLTFIKLQSVRTHENQQDEETTLKN